MKIEGGCYCGKVRFQAVGEPMLRAQCHCRPCQYFSGGAANMFMLMPPEGFAYTSGAPRQFKRDDLEGAVTREFCGDCGTHILTRSPAVPAIILKAERSMIPPSSERPRWRSSRSTSRNSTAL